MPQDDIDRSNVVVVLAGFVYHIFMAPFGGWFWKRGEKKAGPFEGKHNAIRNAECDSGGKYDPDKSHTYR